MTLYKTRDGLIAKTRCMGFKASGAVIGKEGEGPRWQQHQLYKTEEKCL